MADVKEVAENIYLIDNRLFDIPRWGSTYVIKEDRKVMVDTGTAASLNVTFDGLKNIGLKPEDIDFIVLTHIHPDHASGTGVMLRSMPKAKVMVHNRGARYVIDPRKIIGETPAEREATLKKFGEIVAVPESRVMPVFGGEALPLGNGQVLEFIDSPGHAWHELCVFEQKNNGVFTGDAAGVFVNESMVLPSTALPSFNLEDYMSTIDKLAKLYPSRLYYGHFGSTSDPQENLKILSGKVRLLEKTILDLIKNGKFNSADSILRELRMKEIEPVKPFKELYAYLSTTSLNNAVTGFLKYFREKYNIS